MTKEIPQGGESLQHLIDSSVDGILAFDRECRYTVWNRAMEKISGLRREDVVGRIAFELFPFLKETGEDRYFQDALEGRSVVAERRGYVVPETGRKGFFDGYYSPLRNPNGEVAGGVAIIRDITERERAVEALRASEERYRAFLTNSSEGIWRFELEQPVSIELPAEEQIEIFYRHGYLAECNDAMARMYGFERAEEIRGARLGDLLVRTDPQNTEYLQSFVAADYRLTDVQSVEVDREGRQRIFLNNLIGVVENGRLTRAWGTQREITELKRTEDALRESELRFRLMFDQAAVGMIQTTAEGVLLKVNPGFCRMLGYDEEELTGRNIFDLTHTDDRQPDLQHASSVISGAITGYEIQKRFIHKEGRTVWVNLTATAVRDEAGTPLFGLGIVEDITERKRAEGERERLLTLEQEARASAEAANRLKDEFLATVSHELRTPLTAVVGWSRMLRSGNLDSATAEHALDVILRNAQAQAQIVEDILEVSRIITGKIRLNMQMIDPTPAVSAAIDAVKPAAEAKGIIVESDLDPTAGPVRADPDRLQQIAWNLLSNAVKFTHSGGRVDVLLFDLDGHARLEVRDTGQGISTEFLPHVFERFRQADSSTTRQHGGLGLGLAIVRHLAELHGGSVAVTSEGIGKGAIFSVDIPREKVAAEKELLDARLMPEAPVESGTRAAQGLPDLRGARVLVVEDEIDTMDFLATLLGRCNAEVRTTGSVAEALRLYTNWQPQVIVSDLGLPGEDGFSLIRKVRQLEQAKETRTPAVALSGYTRNEDRALSLASGFQKHLAKPAEPFELANVIAVLLEQDNQ